jgi:Fe-S cluster assembly iron-binding protein IscA
LTSGAPGEDGGTELLGRTARPFLGRSLQGSAVLSITPRAWEALEDLTSAQRGAGVRLTRSECGSLSLLVAEAPQQDDTVVWSRGTVVYVDPHAAPAVDRATLDLRSSPGARAFFLR